MYIARQTERLGDKSLHVVALDSPDGWFYVAEVVDPLDGSELRLRASHRAPFPSAMSALAQGMACATCLATDPMAPLDPDTDVAADVRPRRH
jgi:hypothetical protein